MTPPSYLAIAVSRRENAFLEILLKNACLAKYLPNGRGKRHDYHDYDIIRHVKLIENKSTIRIYLKMKQN